MHDDPPLSYDRERVGAVVIGRNEGARLHACLASLAGRVARIVYVDSGSTDASVEDARARGAEVVELDRSRPFTAARGRNAGFARLRALAPEVDLVQLVDGDCEVRPDWLAAAVGRLREEEGLGIVCGRRRERHPGASVYNRLCDMEWDTPVGEATACGGDALARAGAIERVGGYREGMIAGEDPDFSHRVRLAGWRIERMDAEMTLHDAAMTGFGQWWRRTLRSGHAYAENWSLHRADGTGFAARQLRSILAWAIGVPLATVIAAFAIGWPATCLPLLLYGALFVRVRSHRRARGDSGPDSSLYAAACVIGKLAQCAGALRYFLARARGRRSELIEYKAAR